MFYWMLLPILSYSEWVKFGRKASFKMRGYIRSPSGKCHHHFFATELRIVFIFLKVCKTVNK